jgi:hypothetical protein
MTKKRSLLLISLFLVFGLATMASSALAQTQWTTGANENDNMRAQGLAEATGQVSLNSSTQGTVGATTYFKIYYTAPITSLGTVYIVCSGSAAPLSPFNSPGGAYGGVGCGGALVPTLDATSKIMTITFVQNITFPTGASSQISITARVNATAVSCASAVYATVDAHTPTGQPNLTITPNQPSNPLRVGEVQCDPALSLTYGTERSKLETEPAFVLTCIGVKDAAPYENDFTLNVDEEFAYALTSESYEMELDPGSGDGDVTNGTSFTITFSNVPQGVGIENDDIKPCSTLWTGNTLSCPGGTLNIVLEDGQPVVTADTGTPATHTVSFTYDTISVDMGSKESVDLKFHFWSHGPLQAGLASVTANIEKEPTTPATNIPLFIDKWELTTPLTVITFSDCKTYLLYPYLTSGFGFGAGIAVANTTTDPFAADPILVKGSAVPQSGPCTWTLFATNPAGVLSQAMYTSPTIMSGQTFAFDMASKLAPGVSGYSIAVCDFQNAHGYAFITYNLFGNNGVAANYLADVLPNPALYHRSPAGNALGETAVAPYWITRELERLLNYGLR